MGHRCLNPCDCTLVIVLQDRLLSRQPRLASCGWLAKSYATPHGCSKAVDDGGRIGREKKSERKDNYLARFAQLIEC